MTRGTGHQIASLRFGQEDAAISIDINGIAHIFIVSSDFARSRAFYEKLLPFLGMKPVLDGEGFYYCVGGRTAFGIRACAPGHEGERFTQDRVGLHHVCFRAREREDVDRLYDFVRELGVEIASNIFLPRSTIVVYY